MSEQHEAGGAAGVAADPRVLERNLCLLAARSGRMVERVLAATPGRDIALVYAPDGGLTGTLAGRQLGSLRGPVAEGERFAASVDIAANAAVVVRGFGLGHHVAALARRMKMHGAVVVFEPDAALLRAVLERVDCTPWLAGSNVSIITEPEDAGAIAAAVAGVEAILAAGTALVDHPASRVRLSAVSEAFGVTFTAVMKAVRTNVVTTLVQVDVTLKNLLGNLAWYATVPGVADLAGACAGKPAVVVSAGPSLARNVQLLSQPGVRERVVIIAVQTVLKTLLARGIRPHFVTALDYHEISRRFYEGLTAGDVEGVTLVVEPKCNRAILEAFPGAVRCAADAVLDGVLGTGPGGLARPMGAVAPGATVAHLAYYLARFMGCDPVMLIGQDLAFTDGQYYAPGAAIHQVWSGELSEFNTLEMLEWQRIARMKPQLRRVRDHAGGSIYTDEQMATYLVQFERDFAIDAARGWKTIDASEGGAVKQHTTAMPLATALARYATCDVPVPGTPVAMEGGTLAARLSAVRSRLGDLRRSAGRIAVMGREAEGLLDDMLRRQQDQAKVNRLIEQVGAIGTRAAAEAAYDLVQWINQTGQFNRFRADRAIGIDPSLSAMDRQKKEIERDQVNVRWLADAAERVGEMLDDAAAELVRGFVSRGEGARETSHRAAGKTVAITPAQRLWAAVRVDGEAGGLGLARSLGTEFAGGRNALQMMLARLARCERIAGVLLVCADEAEARQLAGAAPAGLRLEYEVVDAPAWEAARARARAVGAARLWSRWCWRGGIANLSCYDEAVSPALLAPILAGRGLDAAVCVGDDWALVDPALVDAVIDRHLERPEVHELVFVHAPPGLGACVVRAGVLKELAAGESPLASMGGLIGYLPHAPQADPIARPACISTPPHVRDLLVRCVPDSPWGMEALAQALGGRALEANAAEVAELLAHVEQEVEMVTVAAAGARKDATIHALAGGHGAQRALTVVDSGGRLDEALRLAQVGRDAGFAAVHVRTPLLGGVSDAQRVLDAGLDVVSVDVLAETAETYTALTGRACFDEVRLGVGHLLEHRSVAGGLPTLWVVPRMTRCDATYEQVEDFFNRGLVTAGACVVEGCLGRAGGERITALPLARNVLERHRHSTLLVGVDGAVRNGAGEIAERPGIGRVNGGEVVHTAGRHGALHVVAGGANLPPGPLPLGGGV